MNQDQLTQKTRYQKGFLGIIVLIVLALVLLSLPLGAATIGSFAGTYSREGTPAEGGVTQDQNYYEDTYQDAPPAGLGCANVPLYRQDQQPWASVYYGCGNTTIKSSGCGVVSAAMVLKFYGVDTNPAILAQASLNNGFRVCGSGTAHAFFPWIARHYGLNEKSRLGWNEILENLNNQRPVIVSGRGSAPFTSGGHYVVLTCYNEDGTISVNDPAKGVGIYNARIIQNQMHFSTLIYRE